MDMDGSQVQAFIAFAQEVLPLLAVAGALVGLYLIGSAGFEMWAAGADGRSMRRSSEAPVMQVVAVKSVIGALLLTFGRTVDMTRELTGGAGAGMRQSLAYAVTSSSASGFWGLVLQAAFLWLAVIGTIAVFRGFLLWVRAGSGEGGKGSDLQWAGFWHIVAGGIAINLGT